MNTNKKTSLVNMPRHLRPVCKFEKKIYGCKNVNCPFRHERTQYAVNEVKCDAAEAKKLKEVLEQPDFFSSREFSNENRRPTNSFISNDSVYRKTYVPQKEELQNKLREKKRRLEETMSTIEKDMQTISKKAKPKDNSASVLEQWKSALRTLENLNSK